MNVSDIAQFDLELDLEHAAFLFVTDESILLCTPLLIVHHSGVRYLQDCLWF